MAQGEPASLQRMLEAGRQHHMAGRFAEARAAYEQVLRNDPRNAEATFLMGTLAYQGGQYKAAQELLEAAVRSDPSRSDYHNNLGLTFQAIGNARKAASAFRQALKRDPRSPSALNNLGMVERDQGNLDAAERLFRDALALQPGYVDAWNNLGGVLLDRKQPQEAARCYERVVEHAPRHPLAHFNLGVAYAAAYEPERALSAYTTSASLDPGFADPLFNVGILLKELGRFDEATEAFRKALTLQPDNVAALYELSGCRRFDARTADVERMQRLYDAPTAPDAGKMLLGFALGKIFDDLGDYDRAFGYFEAANRRKRKTLDYDVDADIRAFDRVIETFDSSFFEARSGYGVGETGPIFVLGMPRSGTSLTEQILSSHPDVHGAGELLDLPKICVGGAAIINERLADEAPALAASEVEAMARRYLDALAARRGDATFVTDKLPENFFYVGMIRLMLPNAKIIHCRRDPLDTCLSNFKNNFDHVNPYSYDLVELGRYYRGYERLMRHWDAVLPGFVYDLRYEDLVADPETRIRDTLAYCGLGYDDNCLNFHRNKRVVRTASEFQVRQPMYRSSVESWRHYEKHLGALRAVLEGG